MIIEKIAQTPENSLLSIKSISIVVDKAMIEACEILKHMEEKETDKGELINRINFLFLLSAELDRASTLSVFALREGVICPVCKEKALKVVEGQDWVNATFKCENCDVEGNLEQINDEAKLMF